jgi:predicted permease
MKDFLLRLRALFRPKRMDHELDDELSFHIAMQTRKYAETGMEASQAAQRARRDFGVAALIKDQCRDQRRVSLIETTVQDIRYALRGFRRTPVFALTVIATIALGLGINTAVFTIFNAYVLRPISVRDPYSLYEADWTQPAGQFSFTLEQFRELQRQDTVFSDSFASRSLQVRIEGRNAFGELVSENYFQMLGVRAAIGRSVLPQDGAPVVVLSDSAWRKWFDGDPEILGKTVSIRGVPLEVVAVMPQSFTGLSDVPHDFWASLALLQRIDPDRDARIRVYGRLKRDLSIRQAEAALSVVAQRIAGEHAGAELRSRATAVPISKTALLLMAPIVAAFGMVLLIACANVANMMLARAMARQREIGIRLSLGAARGRLIRQLLTESILLAIPSGLAGFAISQAAVSGGVRLMYVTLPAEFADYIRVVPLPPDLNVFLFTTMAAIAAGILFGLAPALQATRASVVQAARGDFTNEHRPARLRNTLVIAQITGCSALLILAGVLLRTADRVRDLKTGMRTQDTIELAILEKARARVLSRLVSDPEIESLAASALSPLDDWFPQTRVFPQGDAPVNTLHTLVSPEYFDVFGINIVKGRGFSKSEALSRSAVAIVSESAARRLWPDQEPIGRDIRIESVGVRSAQLLHGLREVRVIGVVGDTLTGVADNDLTRSCVYLPTSLDAIGNILILKVHGNVETARRRIDAALEREIPGSVEEIHKMQEFVTGRQYPFRVAYWVSSTIGILALLLTIAGVYGVIAYLVAQRTKEIGIRMAMGASAMQVITLILNQSARLAGAGLVLGVAIALGGSRVLNQYIMMSAYDWRAYCAGAGVVLTACLGAAFIPSRRASRIDPIATLRYD